MRLEYNFSNQHLEMIEGGADTQNVSFSPVPYDASGIMGNLTGDYIRMSVLNEDGSFIRSFYSNLSVDDKEVIYTSLDDTTAGLTSNTAIIANPSGADLLICTGGNNDRIPCSDDSACSGGGICIAGAPYPIHAGTRRRSGSLQQYCFDIGYSGGMDPDSAITTEVDTYYEYDGTYWTIIQGVDVEVAASVECIVSSALASTEYAQDWATNLTPQLRIYKDVGNNLYVKPNEALEFGDINEGNYQLQFDFLHNPFYVLGTVPDDQKYYFYITEVSPSRKEVRLVTRNGANARVPTVDDDGNIIENWNQRIEGTAEFPGALFNHNFSFVLVVSRARNIPITNYKIDKISDPINPSLILKLYSPLPTDVTRLANVTIEQEIFTTQIENISYRTEAYIEPGDGFGLGYTDGFLEIDDVG